MNAKPNVTVDRAGNVIVDGTDTVIGYVHKIREERWTYQALHGEESEVVPSKREAVANLLSFYANEYPEGITA